VEADLPEHDPVGRWQPAVSQRVLGEHLVRAAHAGMDAGAGVGDAKHLEQLLDRPVLASTPVQRDEGDLGIGLPQRRHEFGADVDRDDLVTEPFQRVLDARP
jgi:hypothetical protein